MPPASASPDQPQATGSSAAQFHPLLHSSRGELMLVSIAVAPRHLEALLDALNALSFPVNPEVYHGAALTRRYPDGREESSLTYLVEFAAYASDLEAVKAALARAGLWPHLVAVRSFLEGASSDLLVGPDLHGCVCTITRKPSSPPAR